MTDQEINEAVAQKLKGWFSKCKCEFPVETAHHNCPGEFGNCHHADTCNLPDYCHSIEAAWEIVEQVDYCHLFRHDPLGIKWECKLTKTDQPDLYARDCDTAPMAICKAFLKLDD